MNFNWLYTLRDSLAQYAEYPIASPPPPLSQECLVTLSLGYVHVLLLLWNSRGTENSMSCEKRVSVSDALVFQGAVLSAPSPTGCPPSSGPRPSPSLHIIQWPETWGGGGCKNPCHLLRLLNESNFLPESTRRAYTSIVTLNYVTLIQINKGRRHQDSSATQQWICNNIFISLWRLITRHKMESIYSLNRGRTKTKSHKQWCFRSVALWTINNSL